MQRSRSTGQLAGSVRLLPAPPPLKGVNVGLQPDALRMSLGGAYAGHHGTGAYTPAMPRAGTQIVSGLGWKPAGASAQTSTAAPSTSSHNLHQQLHQQEPPVAVATPSPHSMLEGNLNFSSHLHLGAPASNNSSGLLGIGAGGVGVPTVMQNYNAQRNWVPSPASVSGVVPSELSHASKQSAAGSAPNRWVAPGSATSSTNPFPQQYFHQPQPQQVRSSPTTVHHQPVQQEQPHASTKPGSVLPGASASGGGGGQHGAARHGGSTTSSAQPHNLSSSTRSAAANLGHHQGPRGNVGASQREPSNSRSTSKNSAAGAQQHQPPQTQVQGSDVVSSSQCFVCDVSCLGSDASGFVESGGPGSSGRFTRSGGETGMLVGVKGFHSGKHYWEILNGSEGGLGASSSAVDIKFGIVPRAVDTRIDVTRSIEENQGYCVTLAQGRHVKTGDTVGVLLDMTGGSARLSFFVNHKFSRHAASIVNIPKSKAFFPAVSLEGNDQTRCTLIIKDSPQLPDLVRHAQAEEDHRTGANAGAATYKDELSARRVALAHNGSTVEISSHLSEDLKLNVGDAILFVDLEDVADGTTPSESCLRLFFYNE